MILTLCLNDSDALRLPKLESLKLRGNRLTDEDLLAPLRPIAIDSAFPVNMYMYCVLCDSAFPVRDSRLLVF